MANANQVLSETPSSSSRKRPYFYPSEPQEQAGGASSDQRKKKKRANANGAWSNLDLIVSLQNKDSSLERKVEIAFDYLRLIDDDGDDRGPEVVRIPRLVSFLIDWIQPPLISSESNKRNTGLFDPCLDYRCWAVLKFCLQNSSIGVSPNLLRAFTHVLQHALLQFAGNSSLDGKECAGLLKHVFECLSLLLLSKSRAFYNTGVELWVSCSVEVVNLVMKVLTIDKLGPSNSEVLLRLSSLLLEHFAGFLRFHPNPRNVFRPFVDRLLEPLLELLILLQLRVNGEKCKEENSLLMMVKEVLSNGVFHPAHISGFLSLRNSNVEQEGRRLKGINESYHRHFFQRLEKMIAEKRAVSLGGFGFLLCLLISKAKSQKLTNLASKVNDASGRHPEIPEEAEETSKSLFSVFTQFLEPLVLECKRCTELDLSQDEELLELRLVEGHCMLKSVNETLASLIDEKIYLPTEDTSEEAHFNFLKEVYEIIVSISGKIYQFWLSMLHMDNVRIKRILCLVAKEIFAAVGYYLEIEYKVVGNELVELWLMIFSYLTVQMPFSDKKPCSSLVSEILKLSCKLINIYGELRQVGNPIFALCKAVRVFTVSMSADSVGNSVFVASSPLSSEMCSQSMAILLGSGTFQLDISSCIKSIPERQANGCLQQLNIDIADSLEWIKHGSVREGISLGVTTISSSSMLDLCVKAELLGRIMLEIYSIILDSLTVTAMNSVLVGDSVENLMKSIRPSFGLLVQNLSDGVNDFFYSITGQRLSNDVLSEHQNGTETVRISIAWFFVFFFGMYSSSRSLYRQSISLMPHNSAKKASDAMGNLFYVSSGMGWRNNLKSLDDGYFSWIAKPSISLFDVIHVLSEDFLSSSTQVYAPLVYALNVMVLQRINDLNRMLKAYEYLQKEGSQVRQVLLENPDIRKTRRRLNRLIAASRNEAIELTNFLSSKLPLMASHGNCICSQSFKTCGVTHLLSGGGTWDMGVCSLNENSLPSQIWLLLCQNIDVWCSHASSKDLKMFLSHLLLYSLPCGSGEPLFDKVNMHQIALELIGGNSLYEQPVLSKYLTSRFCHILKKSFTFLMIHDSANCKDLYSLSEWSETLNTLVQGSAGDMDGRNALPSTPPLSAISCTVPSRGPFHMQLEVCQDLLCLLCKMPGVHVTATSFSVYATHLLNLERLVISNILRSHFDSSASGSYELLRLLVSCRRAMKHLVVASIENVETRKTSYLFGVFNHSTIFWLLKSASVLVGLPHALFGEKYSGQIDSMNFSLVDHTAYIFFTLSRELMNAGLQSTVDNEKLQKNDTSKKDSCNLIDQHDKTYENDEACKLLDTLVEIFANQIGDLSVTLKDIRDAFKQETKDVNISSWNRLSCLLSCLQGFLWGLASTSDSNDHITENQQFFMFSNYCLTRLGKHMVVFENFVYSVISILIVNDQEGSEIHPMHEVPCDDTLSRNIVTKTASKCHFHEEQCAVGNNPMSQKQRSLDEEHIKNSTIKKERISTNHRKWIANAFRAIHDMDLTDTQHLGKFFLQSLLEGISFRSAFLLRQLFCASASILKLKCMLLFPNHKDCHEWTSKSMRALLGASYMILQGLAEMVGKPNSCTFVWIDGILKYLEVVGSYISLTDPNLSKDVYCRFIDIHLRALGKCISLQGKSATLSSHAAGSNTKMLQREAHVSLCQKQYLYAGECGINELKGQLRSSFRKFIGRPTKLHLKAAVQAIEKALIGMQQGCHVVYEVTTGNVDGGKVSPVVAGGIDCLGLILEYVSEQKQIIKESISSIVGCLFNIVLHLQHPKIFYTQNLLDSKPLINPDAGSVILMCIEVLTTIAGKHSFQLEACHTSQCLHIPKVLFKDFHHLRDSPNFPVSMYSPEAESFQDLHGYIVDRQFSVDLYSSCCKLLYTTLKHRIRDVEQCVSLLQDSVITLLNCLETVGANSLSSKGCFTWNLQEAVKCASFLRRIYEEIRQQKDAIGRYSVYFLSSYISIYSGFSPLQAGIKREVDEALRPGIYSLIDICNANDIQQLHTVLDESSCRSTLSSLLRDYQLNFQFEGKV